MPVYSALGNLANMSTYRVFIGDFDVLVETPIELVQLFASMEGKRAALLCQVERYTGRRSRLDLLHVNSQHRQLDWNVRGVHLSWPSEGLADGALFYLAHLLIEQRMAAHGFFSIHGSCVSINGKAVVFLGPSGAGKTSLVLETGIHGNGELVGNDILAIGMRDGRLICLTGTTTLFLRERSLATDFPQLLPLFEPSDDPWSNKIYVSPKRIGLRTKSGPVDVTRAYFVHIDDMGDTLVTKSADTLGTRLYLHEQLSRYIRATAIMLFDRRDQTVVGFLPSLDTPDLLRRRVALVERIISQGSYVAGRLDHVAQFVMGAA